MIENKQIAATQAVLFAAAEPIEYTKLANVLGFDDETMLLVLDELGKKLDSEDSGICLLQLDTKYQLCSKKEFVEEIRILDSPLKRGDGYS